MGFKCQENRQEGERGSYPEKCAAMSGWDLTNMHRTSCKMTAGGLRALSVVGRAVSMFVNSHQVIVV